MKALESTLVRLAIHVFPLVVALTVTVGGALAEPTPEQQSAIRSNCRSDFMANCMGVPRGGAEAMQCLKDNLAKLSAGCQQAIKAVMPAPAPKPPAPAAAAPAPKPAAPAATAAPAPAAPAAAAPAAATPPAAPAPAAPVQATAKPVAPAAPPPAAAAKPAAVKPAAPPAKNAATPPAAPVPAAVPPAVIVVSPRQAFRLVRTSCREEYRAYCSDVDIGGGRVIGCLQANAASLSPGCKAGLAELGR
jgi:hypothetical protein